MVRHKSNKPPSHQTMISWFLTKTIVSDDTEKSQSSLTSVGIAAASSTSRSRPILHDPQISEVACFLQTHSLSTTPRPTTSSPVHTQMGPGGTSKWPLFSRSANDTSYTSMAEIESVVVSRSGTKYPRPPSLCEEALLERELVRARLPKTIY